MKIALSTSAITNGDIDFSPFESMGEVTYFGDVSAEQLKRIAADCEILLINKNKIDESVLAACPKLRMIGTFSTGYDCVDVEACSRRGITVCNVPGYSTCSVTQHVFALLLSLMGNIRKYTCSVESGDWIASPCFSYSPWDMREISGKTFGILGYGSIGKSVAKVADALGAEVIIFTRTPPKNCPYRLVSFDELLAQSDILSLHCPQTEATLKIINAQTIGKMKNGAIIVNTARGGLVDEGALAAALNSGKLAGACIDVLSAEPMSADNPLFGAKNCLITPHIAWAAKETRIRLVNMMAQNVRAFISGSPINAVNK